MIFIELNSNDKRPFKIYVNVQHIGHIMECVDIRTDNTYTNVGVTTHNNGGFKVRESALEVKLLIENAQLENKIKELKG